MLDANYLKYIFRSVLCEGNRALYNKSYQAGTSRKQQDLAPHINGDLKVTNLKTSDPASNTVQLF